MTPDSAPSSNVPRRRRWPLVAGLGLLASVLGYHFVTTSSPEVRPSPDRTVFSQRVANEPSVAQRPAAENDELEAPVPVPLVEGEQAPAPSGIPPEDPVEPPPEPLPLPPGPDAGIPDEPPPPEPAEPPEVPEYVELEQCGAGLCPAGYVCCNASCGICTPPGGTCSTFTCTAQQEPTSAVSCGRNTCNSGEFCCNESCGTCSPLGATCDPAPCGNAVQYPTAVSCGMRLCNSGEVCCNESCGTCAAPGETCDQTQCASRARIPIAATCGGRLCNSGEVCCNDSCGICAAPGESCSDAPCTPPVGTKPYGTVPR